MKNDQFFKFKVLEIYNNSPYKIRFFSKKLEYYDWKIIQSNSDIE